MQRVNKLNIEKEVREVEHRLSLLKQENARQEQQYREMKSSGSLGSSGDVVTRDMTIQIEEEISTAKNEYKVNCFLFMIYLYCNIFSAMESRIISPK